MKSVESNGGPLVAVPAEWAKSWCGTEAPPGAKVPSGWEWSGNDEDPVRTDYDRACGKLRAFHESSYGGLGLVKCGGGDALVLEGPTSTQFLPAGDGGVFLRNVTFASVRAAKKSVSSAPRWKKTRAELTLKDGRLFLFDAAYPYPGATKTRLGRPAILIAKLKPGRYRVSACDWMPEGTSDYELRAYRLDPVSMNLRAR